MENAATMNAPNENIVGTVYERIFKSIIDALKPFPVWRRMSENEQDSVIRRLDIDVRDAIRQAVFEIAADDRATIAVNIESVAVKKDIKAVVTLSKDSEYRHELVDSQGQAALLIIADPGEYTKGNAPKAEPDQKDLELKNKVDSSAEAFEREERERKAAERARRIDECHATLHGIGLDWFSKEDISKWTEEQIVDALAWAHAAGNLTQGSALPPMPEWMRSDEDDDGQDSD
jgi:hypothetical protein